jgi:hypothetical protein
MNPHPIRLKRILLLVVACALAASGCFNPFDPLVSSKNGTSEPPPAAVTARGVLERFGWCWRNKAIAEYREVFTDDYVFQFAERDTAGNAFRDRPWIREDELASATNLFVGGGSTEPPADRITLEFTNQLKDYDDHRAGKDSVYHREIRAEVNLLIYAGGSQIEVRGPGLFYMVRGDSAAIPEELRHQGFGPDSNRWYIERWEDETLSEGGATPLATLRKLGLAAGPNDIPPTPFPPPQSTWGAVKRYWRVGPLR